MSKYKFKSEVSQLLHLIIHSLYSHKEIFLRELISNASDALDKLKYLTLTDAQYKDLKKDFRIDLEFEEDSTLIVKDTGVGMNKTELQENLGTIARSGTKEFLSHMGEKKSDAQSELIGQFGVGFYSVFMVAERVEVLSRKAGESEAWRWISKGEGSFTIDQAEKETHGTVITVHLNKEGKEYASKWQLESLVKKYSNHVPFPIFLQEIKKEKSEETKEEKSEDAEPTQLNAASALWKRNKSDISEEEYEEFYKSLDADVEKPLFHLHTQAEGALEYTTLFYVPSRTPFDLFSAEFKPGVKLYIKRVFISDEKRELIPSYLRFVRGIIDSEDLPLNVSREMIQDHRVLHSIRNASVKKLLSEFERISKEDPALFTRFIDLYNKPLKEGLYTDFANKDKLTSLIRFKSSHNDGHVSLAEYVSRMSSEQKAIYYLSGDSEKNLRVSPLVASYRARSVEVLLLPDEIDEVIIPMIGNYEGHELKPINRVGSDADLKEEMDTEQEKHASALVTRMKEILKEHAKDVLASALLADSPCCVIWDTSDPSRRMQQIMAAMGQEEKESIKPVLEINPSHPIIKKLDTVEDEAMFQDIVLLLFEGALLVEGSLPTDSVEFVKRLNHMLENTL